MQKSYYRLYLFRGFVLLFCLTSIFEAVGSENVKGKVANQYQNVALRKKLGQLLVLDFKNWGKDNDGKDIPYTEPNTTVERIVKDYNPGGIILFKENTVSPSQTVKLVQSFQQNSDIPLIIAIDQEGGIVTRLQSGTRMPGNMLLGAARKTEITRSVAEVIGRELACQAINMDFAPVLDVNSNPENPVIGVRSFSSNPALVSKLGVAYINGLNRENVMACVKHFPGHGDTAADTHAGLTTVKHNRKQLNKIDLPPFKAAINAGVSAVMTAHVIVPALDNSKQKSIKDGKVIGTPATLSKPIITGILRKKFGFKGLVITDAMDMKAISDNFGKDEAVKKAILAGADLLLMPVKVWCSEDVKKLEKLIDFIQNEYITNRKFKDRIDDSYERIIAFKEKHRVNIKNFKNSKMDAVISNAEKIVGSRQNHAIERFASEKGITLLENQNNILPFRMADDCRILVICSNSLRLKIVSNEIQKIANYNKETVKVKTLKADYKRHITDKLKKAVKNSDIIILLTYNLDNSDLLPGQIINFAKKRSIKRVTVSCRNPYDIAYTPGVDANLCIYGAPVNCSNNEKITSLGINLRTAIKTIFLNLNNKKPLNSPEGKLPVSIPGKNRSCILYKYGHGLKY